jgi:uncharacterized protein with FMN-binding domain
VRRARRNVTVIGASGVTLALLFLYPTSTGNGHGAATKAAPPGIVTPSSRGAARPSTVVVNGDLAATRYGPVQVQITLRTGRIVSAAAIVYPQDSRRDREINAAAIPRLNQEVVHVQSAKIDTVSGATYTSEGYRRSLQSALDAAHA